MEALAAIFGLVVPLAAAIVTLRAFGADPIASLGLVAASAALNSFWPVGGGMAVDGSYRTRFVRWEWTCDARRSARERFLGPFGMAAVAFGGFLVGLPAVMLGYWLAGPWSAVGSERLTIGALAALVVVGLARHRPEVPLARFNAEPASPQEWAKRVAAMRRVLHADGSIGNTGGIGASTVGLHEHLDAVEALRKATQAGIAGAAELLAPALAHLQARREGTGFPVYPGALPRAEFTQRAESLLARSEAKA